jgi:hypothetical protein
MDSLWNIRRGMELCLGSLIRGGAKAVIKMLGLREEMYLFSGQLGNVRPAEPFAP